jgi:pimeloyl-ACP methyl ester carboxylesterase
MRERTVTGCDGVELHLYEVGDEGPLVVLVHGFPELGYSWRHQLPALAGAGYRVVAPDLRGLGRSTGPEAIEDYDVHHQVADLMAVLDDLGEERAVFVGHDWGSMLASHAVLLHPERSLGLVNISVPHLPRGPVSPLAALRSVIGDGFFYVLYFQEPGVADANLDADVRKVMTAMMCARFEEGALPDPSAFVQDGRGLAERLPEPDGLPAWLTQEELDVFVEAYERTGFTAGLNLYRNFDRNWASTEQLAEAKIEVPSLFIGGSADPVTWMMPPTLAHASLTDHRGDVLVKGAGHWVHQERRDVVNAALLGFLDELALPSVT